MGKLIEFATIDELIDEIESRAEASVVIYELQEKAGEGGVIKMRYDGGTTTALGMCHATLRNLTDQVNHDPW